MDKVVDDIVILAIGAIAINSNNASQLPSSFLNEVRIKVLLVGLQSEDLLLLSFILCNIVFKLQGESNGVQAFK